MKRLLILPALLLSCKSYELTSGGRAVQLFSENSSLFKSMHDQNSKNSPFSKCKYLGKVTSHATDSELKMEGRQIVSGPRDTDERTINDFKNQASEKGANLVFIDRCDYTCLGVLYRCDGLDALIQDQKKIDALVAKAKKPDYIQEALKRFDEASALRNAGKSVKAEREQAEAEALLEQHIKPNMKMSFPEGCNFRYTSNSSTYGLTFICEDLFRINLIDQTDDKRILEKLQDCTESCTGEFYIVSISTNELQYSSRRDGKLPALDLRIKFLDVKQIKPMPTIFQMPN